MDSSPPGSSVQGILQAGTLQWVAISFSKFFQGVSPNSIMVEQRLVDEWIMYPIHIFQDLLDFKHLFIFLKGLGEGKALHSQPVERASKWDFVQQDFQLGFICGTVLLELQNQDREERKKLWSQV